MNIETAVVRREGVMDDNNEHVTVMVWVRAVDEEAGIQVTAFAGDEDTATELAVDELQKAIAEQGAN